MTQKKHAVKRLDSENGLYRGKVIELCSHIPTGYSGRYKIGRIQRFSTQKQAKEYIDNLCMEKGIDSFMNQEQIKQFIAEW